MKVAALLVPVICAIAAAQGEPGIEEMVFCTSVQDRAPVGESAAFDNDVGTVWCFTKIVGAELPDTVYHVWYYKDEEMARVALAVSSDSWRTWSSKRVLESWAGVWRVEVQTGDGTVLEAKEFAVRQPAPPGEG